MKTTKEHALRELLQFIKAPTYFAYCLALILVYILQFLPGLRSAESLAAADSFGAAAARLFGSEMGTFLQFFPAFVISTALLRDIRVRKLKGIHVREGMQPAAAVGLRYAIQTGLLFLPVLIIAVLAGKSMESAEFLVVAFLWLLPTIAAVAALSCFLTELSGHYLPGILAQLVVWIFTSGSTADTGDYNSCLAIRHAVFGGYESYTENFDTLIVNRVVVVLIAAVLVAAAIFAYGIRSRKTK